MGRPKGSKNKPKEGAILPKPVEAPSKAPTEAPEPSIGTGDQFVTVAPGIGTRMTLEEVSAFNVDPDWFDKWIEGKTK